MGECILRKTLPKRKNLPWLSKGLVNSIRRRNLLYKQGKLSGDLSKYRRMRNKVTCKMRRAKRDYFQYTCSAAGNLQLDTTVPTILRAVSSGVTIKQTGKEH